MPDIIPIDMPASYWCGKAREARKSGSLREAVRLYRRTLAKRNDNGIRLELAQVYADMRCMTASDRLYMENLARDPSDTDSLYGLARNRSLMGDEQGMADLLDLYLHLAPCGEQADEARDILWRMPRDRTHPKRLRRARTLYAHALERGRPGESLRLARLSWKKGKTPEGAALLAQIYLRLENAGKALQYALKACEMQPDGLQPRLILAAALHAGGLPHACRAALQQASLLCRDPDRFPEFCGCAVSLGQADLASAFLEKQLADRPDSADLMLLLAASLRSLGGHENRVSQLARAAGELDPDNSLAQLLLEYPEEDEDDAARYAGQLLKHLQEIAQKLAEGDPDGSRDSLHRELMYLMHLPLPGVTETAVRLFLMIGDTLGLRMALMEANLPPMLLAVVLQVLSDLHSPLPCFAAVEGRLALLPQKPEKPYDGDLHDLIRSLARDLPGSVSLDLVVREVPALWRRLPESARSHCAQSGDDIWHCAFSAYLAGCAGDAGEVRKRLEMSGRPMRTGRAYMQLIRRSGRPYEVYRF